jgi:hypothetical protein
VCVALGGTLSSCHFACVPDPLASYHLIISGEGKRGGMTRGCLMYEENSWIPPRRVRVDDVLREFALGWRADQSGDLTFGDSPPESGLHMWVLGLFWKDRGNAGPCRIRYCARETTFLQCDG